MRLRDFHLRAVPAVVDPRAEDPGAVVLLEVHEWADEHDGVAVVPYRFDDRPAGRLLREPRASNGDLCIKSAHRPTTLEPTRADVSLATREFCPPGPGPTTNGPLEPGRAPVTIEQ